MRKVTFGFSEKDIANIERIQSQLHARSMAQSASIALSLTRFIVDQLADGRTELLLKTPDGLQKVVMAELENARDR